MLRRRPKKGGLMIQLKSVKSYLAFLQQPHTHKTCTPQKQIHTNFGYAHTCDDGNMSFTGIIKNMWKIILFHAANKMMNN